MVRQIPIFSFSGQHIHISIGNSEMPHTALIMLLHGYGGVLFAKSSADPRQVLVEALLGEDDVSQAPLLIFKHTSYLVTLLPTYWYHTVPYLLHIIWKLNLNIWFDCTVPSDLKIPTFSVNLNYYATVLDQIMYKITYQHSTYKLSMCSDIFLLIYCFFCYFFGQQTLNIPSFQPKNCIILLICTSFVPFLGLSHLVGA